MAKGTSDKREVICIVTDVKTGRSAELSQLTEKRRRRASKELTLRALQAYYGPDWEVKEAKATTDGHCYTNT